MTDLSDDHALTFAKSCISLGGEHEHPGMWHLARAVVRLHAKLIDVEDRLILFTFAADRGAADRGAAAQWPATVEAIERVLAKYEAP